MKRLFAAALLATAVATIAPVRADTTVKLVEVITSPPRTAFLKTQLAEVEKANPGLHVEVISLPWGQAFEKFLNMVQAGDTPDMVEMPERWLGLYANNAQLEDLGPYLKTWPDYATLGDRARQFGAVVNGTMYELPYGFYVRALFWNKKMFAAAGVTNPPATLDEFYEISRKIAATPGKYGYCLRGGPGGFTGAQMFMNIANGKAGYFNSDGTSTFNDPGSIKGLQLLADIYQKGYAPKDSVNWGFNEIVAGFYTSTCAMLDQDPDALIGVADKMNADDFAVAPLPTGPSGKSYPSLGYSGWAMFANSQVKDATWKVIAYLSSPKANLEWAKFVGVLPIHNGADNDPFFARPQFAGWFTELKMPDKFEFVTVPSHLENMGIFFDSMAPKGIQQVLLGQRTAKDVADEWAKYLTEQQQAYLAKAKK